MAANSKLEALVEGKTPEVQNRLRKAVADAGLTENDAVWALLEVLDTYASEMAKDGRNVNEGAEKAAAIHEKIQKDMRTSLSRQYKQIREVSLSTFAEKLDERMAEFDNKLRDSAHFHTRKIEAAMMDAQESAAARIKNQSAVFSEKADKEIDKILAAARKKQADPFQRLLVFLFQLTVFGGFALGFALLFIAVGHEAALGNSDFIFEVWGNIGSWIKGLFV